MIKINIKLNLFMKLYELLEYNREINEVRKTIDLSFLDNKTIFISGASGLVMSYFVDLVLSDKKQNTNFVILVHSERSKGRFPLDEKRISYVYGSVINPNFTETINKKIDIVISAASITDPKGYQERPVDTMLINFFGTKNLLDIAVKNQAKFLLISSCEVYGTSDVKLMDEDYCGKINPMDVRSCYNESKRASETLCVSYAKEHNICINVARVSRSFGPTQSINDTKALSQFMKNGIQDEDIVLKSKGDQLFSFTYVADVVTGLLTILNKGEPSNAYNVCGKEVLSLKEIAEIVASHANKKVIFDFKDDGLNKNGYSRTSLAIQDCSKLEALGWKPVYNLKDSIAFTMDVLKKLYY